MKTTQKILTALLLFATPLVHAENPANPFARPAFQNIVEDLELLADAQFLGQEMRIEQLKFKFNQVATALQSEGSSQTNLEFNTLYSAFSTKIVGAVEAKTIDFKDAAFITRHVIDRGSFAPKLTTADLKLIDVFYTEHTYSAINQIKTDQYPLAVITELRVNLGIALATMRSVSTTRFKSPDQTYSNANSVFYQEVLTLEQAVRENKLTPAGFAYMLDEQGTQRDHRSLSTSFNVDECGT